MLTTIDPQTRGTAGGVGVRGPVPGLQRVGVHHGL